MIMNNCINSTTLEKEEEVKKLQELVMKLELQNKELRLERHALLSENKVKNSLATKQHKAKLEKETRPNQVMLVKNERCSLEDSLSLGLGLTLEEYALSDDETWLFDSPNARSENEWLREDLNDPSLTVVKKCLVEKLDEISNSPKHFRHSMHNTNSSRIISPPPFTGEIDTRTFIRSKKRQSLFTESVNDEKRNTLNNDAASPDAVVASHNSSREHLARSSGSLGSEDEDHLSSASDGSYSSFRFADVEDVNAVARLQEESLKLLEPRPGGTQDISGRTMLSRGSRLPSLTRRLGGSDTRLLDIRTSPNTSRASSPPLTAFNPKQRSRHLETKTAATPVRSSRLQTPSPRGSRLSAPSPVRFPAGMITAAKSLSDVGAPPPVRQQGSAAILRAGTSRLQSPKNRVPSKSGAKYSSPNDWREGCY